MYKTCELESVFVEVIHEGKKNKIYACIYRHPTMEVDDFNKNFFEQFIEKLSSENKIAYLLGAYKIDLLFLPLHLLYSKIVKYESRLII